MESVSSSGWTILLLIGIASSYFLWKLSGQAEE